MEAKSSILVVEDSASLRDNLVQALTMGGYHVEAADNGLSALQLFGDSSFDAIVTDIRMPGMDGLTLLDHVLRMRREPETAVILMTAYMTVESAVSSLKKGAYDYITKPFKVEQLLHTVQTVIDKRRLKLENIRLTKELKELNLELEKKVRLRTTELQDSRDELRRSYLEIIKSFAVVLEERDAYTQGHSSRVTEYSVRIASEMSLDDGQIVALQIGGSLHDIGKIGVPEEVLCKTTKLTDDEWRIMREHPDKGARMIEPLSFLSTEKVLIRHHHERWDGKGYPDGLAGQDIPLLSRILCVADAFDAMTSTRSYRRRMTLDVAVKRLTENKGTQFDPDVVDAFVKCLGKCGIVTNMDCIILAAGKGKRMNNANVPKVLTELNGKPLLGYVLDLVGKFGMRDIYVVVGHGAQGVMDYVKSNYTQITDDLGRIVFVHQEEQLGTAHAVMQVIPHIRPSKNSMIILNGDTPLLTFDIINRLMERLTGEDAQLALTTAVLDEPGSLGRIKRNDDGNLEAIIEAADATDAEKEIKEINVGVYCLGSDHSFLDLVGQVGDENAQGEYYLTDAVKLLLEKGGKAAICQVKDSREALGINTEDDLKLAEQYLSEIGSSISTAWQAEN